MILQKYKKEYLRLSLFLTVALMLTFFSPIPKSSAQWVVIDPTNLVPNIKTQIESTIQTTLTTVMKTNDVQRYLWDQMNQKMLPALKAATIRTVNSAVTSVIGRGNKGKPQFITNWRDYLYQQPQQEATKYMNTFFQSTVASTTKTISEGINTTTTTITNVQQNYQSYMIQQARNTFENTGANCKMNLQNYAADPKQQMFQDQSFRSFMAFMEPCNNPYTYSEIDKAQYDKRLESAQTIAKSQQSNGWLPKVDSVTGILSAPATLYQNAMEQASQLANQAVVNAQSYAVLISSAAIKLGGSNASFNFN